jgi:hypothetical protein
MERNPRKQMSILDEITLAEAKYVSIDEYKRILQEVYFMPEKNIKYRLLDVALAKPELRNRIMWEDLEGLAITKAYEGEMSKFFYEMMLN